MPRLGVRREEYRTYTQNFDEDIPGTTKRRRKHKIKTDHREVYHNDRRLTSLPRNSTHAELPCSGANHPYSAVTTFILSCTEVPSTIYQGILRVSPPFLLHTKLITSSCFVSENDEVFMR